MSVFLGNTACSQKLFIHSKKLFKLILNTYTMDISFSLGVQAVGETLCLWKEWFDILGSPPGLFLEKSVQYEATAS